MLLANNLCPVKEYWNRRKLDLIFFFLSDTRKVKSVYVMWEKFIASMQQCGSIQNVKEHHFWCFVILNDISRFFHLSFILFFLFLIGSFLFAYFVIRRSVWFFKIKFYIMYQLEGELWCTMNSLKAKIP